MNKRTVIEQSFLVLGALFCFVPINLLGNTEIDVDQRIERLNKSVLRRMISVEAVTRTVYPVNMRPQTFIVKRNFGYRASKIVDFIDFLTEHKHELECQKTLTEIMEIFYLQFHQFIGEAKSMRLLSEQRKENGRQSRFVQRNVRAELREVLYKIYDCQKIQDGTSRYPYSEYLPLGLIMTKAVIEIFRTRSLWHKWSYEKQVDYVSQQLDAAKKEVLLGLNAAEMRGAALFHAPTPQEVSDFFDALKVGAIDPRIKMPWGKIGKIVLSLSLLCGGAYGIYWVITRLADALPRFGERAAEGFWGQSPFGTAQPQPQPGGQPGVQNPGLHHNLEVGVALNELAAALAYQFRPDQPEGGFSQGCRALAGRLNEGGGALFGQGEIAAFTEAINNFTHAVRELQNAGLPIHHDFGVGDRTGWVWQNTLGRLFNRNQQPPEHDHVD